VRSTLGLPLIDLMALRFLCHRGPAEQDGEALRGIAPMTGARNFESVSASTMLCFPAEDVIRASIPRLDHIALHCSQRRSKGIARERLGETGVL